MVAPAAPLRAGEPTQVTVAVAADSWYRASAACGTLLGCPTTPSTYPADTRHVGVQTGAEESRAYLQLDLASLPADRRLTAGILTVPIGDSAEGTVSPEAARVLACVAGGPLAESDGTYTAEPPEASCGTATSLGALAPATPTSPAALVFNLAPLVVAWQTSGAPGALALVPAPGAALTDTWHITFSGAQRNGFARPTAAITYTASQPSAAPSPSTPTSQAPVAQPGGTAIPGAGAAGAPVPLGQPSPGPAVAGRPLSPPTVGALEPVSVTLPRFRYPAVFLLPLLLVAAATWLGRALTREL